MQRREFIRLTVLLALSAIPTAFDGGVDVTSRLYLRSCRSSDCRLA